MKNFFAAIFLTACFALSVSADGVIPTGGKTCPTEATVVCPAQPSNTSSSTESESVAAPEATENSSDTKDFLIIVSGVVANVINSIF